MSSYDGREHERIAGRIAKTFSILSPVIMAFNPFLGLGVLVGAWVGFFLTPDIDMPGSRSQWTMEEHRAVRLFGCVGSLWVALWQPYARLFGHRNPLTHGFWGTPIRALCLFWPLVLLMVRYRWWGMWPFWMGLLAAWGVQDLLHYWKDGLLV